MAPAPVKLWIHRRCSIKIKVHVTGQPCVVQGVPSSKRVPIDLYARVTPLQNKGSIADGTISCVFEATFNLSCDVDLLGWLTTKCIATGVGTIPGVQGPQRHLLSGRVQRLSAHGAARLDPQGETRDCKKNNAGSGAVHGLCKKARKRTQTRCCRSLLVVVVCRFPQVCSLTCALCCAFLVPPFACFFSAATDTVGC